MTIDSDKAVVDSTQADDAEGVSVNIAKVASPPIHPIVDVCQRADDESQALRTSKLSLDFAPPINGFFIAVDDFADRTQRADFPAIQP